MDMGVSIAVMDIELFGAMKKGDEEALKKWLNRYGKEIARLAFQYGTTIQDANVLAAATFRQLFIELKEIENSQQLFYRMYQIAIEKLLNVQMTEVNEFLFEEDYLLHQDVIQLEPEDKLTFILSFFSKMNDEQLTEILSLPIEFILGKNNRLLDKWQEAQIERRLKLLHKSYDRINFHIDEEKVFRDSHEPQVEMDTQTLKKSKQGIYFVLSGIALLAALIIFSMINSEPYKRASTEKWIEQMKATYEEQLSATYEKLGLTEENFAGAGTMDMFGSRYLSYQEKNHFDSFIKRIERDFEDEKELDKHKISKQFDEFIENLKVPSEMAEEIFKQPLTNDLKASEAFLERYIPKYYILGNVYGNAIYTYPEVMEVASINEGIDLNLLKNIATFPNEVQQLIYNMTEQNIHFDYLPEEFANRNSDFYKKLRASLHPSVGGYISILESQSHAFYSLPDTPDNAFEYIQELEQTLQATTMKSEFLQMLEYRYAWALLAILRAEGGELYDKEGRVNKEVRQEWEAIVSSNENPIAAYIVKKVLLEFEETDWTVSDTQVFLSEHQIVEIVAYAKNNDVDTYNWEEDRLNDLIYLYFPNEGFNYIVSSTYEQFKQNYDRDVLKKLRPITIAGMFFYANEKDDAETVWHLYHESAKQADKADYMSNWEQEKYSYSELNHLYFDKYGKTTNYGVGDTYGHMQFVQEEEDWFIRSIIQE
ncbi:RNA polymerase sigma factor [Sporosarcina pasteurii]|uniref:Uncharacterized protein n=1 Tax=Sporosarcina pasteurii TaxID=1474 RepID=A0A380C881_SPOPA|nr:hypothetical protein [Sporosarcina pasteurii]MDS9472804.1 hypothetical protein [Sporosarcina pasteurii]QBQ04455.1 hypothetical protein E2C16_01460 [Sporosarcina pasteurii]SUJ14950.1 Uncharacterised protein [Sporosarcina pasteurii]